MVEQVMNENEFELDGKVYVAVHGGGCGTCCFNNPRSGRTCMLMPCIPKKESYKEKEMTYCHVSTQCDKYAEEEGRKQELEDEISIVADDLYYQLPEWARSWIDSDAEFIVNEAKLIIEKRSKEYYE